MVKNIKNTKSFDKQIHLIILDQDGKEISRKPKEDGKHVKSLGYTKGKGGNYYKTIQVNKIKDEDVQNINSKSRKTTVIRNDNKTTTQKIIWSCLPTEPPVQKDHLIIIENPVFHMVSGCGLKNLPYNSMYARVVLDTKSKDVLVWILNRNKSEPDFIIKECIV